MLIVFQVLAGLFFLSTLIALLARKEWWVRVFDFPRLQLIVLLAISIAGLLVFGELAWFNLVVLILTVTALVIQLVYVFPYFPFATKDVPDYLPESLCRVSFLVANVLMDNRKCEKLKESIRQYAPEIVLLVEADRWWQDTMSEVMTGFEYRVEKPQDNTYGMLLYSRLPLQDVRVEYLIREGVPSIHARVVKGEVSFGISCLHPEPPSPSEADSSGPRDRELINMATKIQHRNIPHVVLGDMNDVAWSDSSYQFEKVSRLRDPRKGRGFLNTYNAKIPLFRWALDHIFVSEEFSVAEMKRLPAFGSDHFPVYIRCGIV